MRVPVAAVVGAPAEGRGGQAESAFEKGGGGGARGELAGRGLARHSSSDASSSWRAGPGRAKLAPGWRPPRGRPGRQARGWAVLMPQSSSNPRAGQRPGSEVKPRGRARAGKGEEHGVSPGEGRGGGPMRRAGRQ